MAESKKKSTAKVKEPEKAPACEDCVHRDAAGTCHLWPTPTRVAADYYCAAFDRR